MAGDPIAGVLEAAGWEGCGTWQLASAGPQPTTTAIEAAAAAALVLPGGDGWADIAVGDAAGPRIRAWLGHDEPRAALAHGSTLMVFGGEDPDGPWLLTTFDHRPRLIQLRVVDTPGGWRAWLPTANVAGLSLGADPQAPACGAKAP